MVGLVGTARVFNHHINLGYYWLALIDAFIFACASVAGAGLYFLNVPGGLSANVSNLPLQAAIFALVTTLCMFSMGLYEPRLREGVNGVLLRTAGAFGLMTVAMSLVFYMLPELRLWRGNFAMSATIALTGALTNRLVWTRFLDLEQLKRRVLILGSGNTAASINQKMRRRADRRGFRVVGYVRGNDDYSAIEGEPTLNLSEPLPEFARKYRIDEIVVALDNRRDSLPQEELLKCREQGVRVLDVVDFFEQVAGKVVIKHVHPSWFTFATGFQNRNANSFAQRIFDVSIAFVLLSLSWPVMLLTIAAIWIEDGIGAPVLYRQRRVGLNGRIFEVVKFRSMAVNAESDGKARWATANDSRVTRVGRVIRKIRIDELPQILNVMAGDMAFVGPRPERPEFVRELSEEIPYYEKRHSVKPGITGWAQMNYPYGSTLTDAINKHEFDLYYVKHQSLFLDVLVLLQTVEVILFGKGAR
ncbi:MAG: TIGR03013 family XrtA/PEP-CTERM system glycosyltransferase [Pseudomonadota bacterium]